MPTFSPSRAAPLVAVLAVCLLAGCAASGSATIPGGYNATAATGVGDRADGLTARQRLRALKSSSSTDFLDDN